MYYFQTVYLCRVPCIPLLVCFLESQIIINSLIYLCKTPVSIDLFIPRSTFTQAIHTIQIF